MYYKESLILFKQRPLDKDTIIALDREFAHAYNPDGTGHVDASLLTTRILAESSAIGDLAREYQQSGVVREFRQMRCTQCGEKNYDEDPSCKYCGCSLSPAKPAGPMCYNVLKQPAQPAFDPSRQPTRPEAFISYKHSDTSQLAADTFYSLIAHGHSVFLDSGEILPGVDPQTVFLQAASSAKVFIMLVSQDYFSSPYCRKEVAHASRSGARLVRVNVGPIPAPPAELPWIDGPQWLDEKGWKDGLSMELEASILKVLDLGDHAASPADYRREGCLYLLEQMSLNDLTRIRTRLTYMQEIRPPSSKADVIDEIMRETTGGRMGILCNVLSP